jgi:hypothetical protein
MTDWQRLVTEVFIFTEPLDGVLGSAAPILRWVNGGMDYSTRRTTDHWGLLVCPFTLTNTREPNSLTSRQYVERHLCLATQVVPDDDIQLGWCYELDTYGNMFGGKKCKLLISTFGTESVRRLRVGAFYHLGQTYVNTASIASLGASP